MQTGSWLKVKRAIFLRFYRINSDIKSLRIRLPHSLPTPELASKLQWPAHRSWMPRLLSLLFVHLKMQAVTLKEKHRYLEHEVSLKHQHLFQCFQRHNK